MNESPFYPDNLVWIRKKRGLNKTALAKLVDVDLRSISAYEAGEFSPSPEKIAALTSVLRVGDDYFATSRAPGPEASQVSFRSYSKLSAVKRDMALGTIATSFEFNEWLSSKFNLPTPDVPDLREENDPEQAAMSLRYMWGLGEKPISNMIHLLESRGIRVFSMRLAMSDVDACCTWKDDQPFIFLNTQKSNARRRFDAAHELAHLVLHRHGDYDQEEANETENSDKRSSEREADEFASAFLMPRNGFVSSSPPAPNLPSIMKMKSYWGVSVAATIVRLHRTGIISDWHYRTLFQQISQKGYRRKEPYDSPKEMSRIADIALKSLRQDNISLGRIADELSIQESDLTDILFDLAIVSIEGGSLSAAGTKSKTPPNLKLVKY